MSRFVLGEHVEVRSKRGLTGSVKGIDVDSSGKTLYRVGFDDTTLIPSEMEYSEAELREYSKHTKHPAWMYDYWGGAETSPASINKETHCPDCNKKWTISKSPVHAEEWKDCKKCGKRYEDFK